MYPFYTVLKPHAGIDMGGIEVNAFASVPNVVPDAKTVLTEVAVTTKVADAIAPLQAAIIAATAEYVVALTSTDFTGGGVTEWTKTIAATTHLREGRPVVTVLNATGGVVGLDVSYTANAGNQDIVLKAHGSTLAASLALTVVID